MEEIAAICSGKWKNKSELVSTVSYISLDTRKISYPAETIFFAIKSKLRDANVFLENVYQNGVRNFVTDDETIDANRFPGANILVVDNTIQALQNLATYHRNQFSKK